MEILLKTTSREVDDLHSVLTSFYNVKVGIESATGSGGIVAVAYFKSYAVIYLLV